MLEPNPRNLINLQQIFEFGMKDLSNDPLWHKEIIVLLEASVEMETNEERSCG